MVDPETLGAVIALVLGRQPGKPLVGELARVLEQHDEVLPWLMLRQGAFDGDGEIQARLAAAAAAGNAPMRQRPDGPVIAPESYVRNRDIETAMARMIADNIAGTDRADALGALLHAHNNTLPGRPGYDYRRRIAERAPLAEPEACAGRDSAIKSSGESSGEPEDSVH